MKDQKEIEKAFNKEFGKSDDLLVDQIHFEFNKLLNMLGEVTFKDGHPGSTYLKMTTKAVKEGQDYFNSLKSVRNVPVGGKIEPNAKVVCDLK